jgi:hypothetical protein
VTKLPQVQPTAARPPATGEQTSPPSYAPPSPRAVALLRKPLFHVLGILLLVIVALNVFIARMSKTSLREQMLTRLSQIPADTDFLFVGNSVVEAGCDTATFKTAWFGEQFTPKPVNIALGATSPVEQFLILNRALKHPLPLKYVVYGFFDDQLVAPVKGDWASLIGNRAFSYYFPDEAAAFYAPGSTLKKWQLRLTAHVPMLADRSSLWGKVEQLRRKMQATGMPRQKTNRFGRVQDFAALEPADAAFFERRCQAAATSRAGFSPPVASIIKLAREHGAKVLLVEMPMPSRHRALFYSSPAWKKYRDHLMALAQREQAEYIPAADWVSDDTQFEDATHLNETGASVFSAKLAEAMSASHPRPQIATQE